MEKKWQQKTDFLASELERKKGPDDGTKLKYIALEKVKRIGMNLEQKMQTEQGMIVDKIKKYREDRDNKFMKDYDTHTYMRMKPCLPGGNNQGYDEALNEIPWLTVFVKDQQALENTLVSNIQNESLLRLLSFVATSLKDIS